MVLDRPEISLHTKGSENDIRCHVTRRKLSGGTRSDLGRDCRDAFLGLAKTRAKLKIAFWDYLGDRCAIQAPKPFRTCHKSSSQQRNRPDRHEFCPSYHVLLSSIAAEPSRNVSLWSQSFRHLGPAATAAIRVQAAAHPFCGGRASTRQMSLLPITAILGSKIARQLASQGGQREWKSALLRSWQYCHSGAAAKSWGLHNLWRFGNVHDSEGRS
jgi:hypothetical protein